MQRFDLFDDAYASILSMILAEGRMIAPRRQRTLEVPPFCFVLRNPRSRIVENPARHWSLPLAIGELCWHLSGSNELQFIGYYARKWKELVGDSATIRGSCYGHAVFTPSEDGRSQWQRIIELLRKDSASRRATLIFQQQTGDLLAEKDVPCATSMQFLIRDSALHAVISMRSNDAIWGLPYDVFLFTMFQELLACQLNLELGTYTHMVGSLHLYERHFALARRVIESRDGCGREMSAMHNHYQLARFLELEIRLRTGQHVSLNDEELHAYWRELLSVLEWFAYVKKVGYHRAKDKIPLNSPYASLLSNLVPAQSVYVTS